MFHDTIQYYFFKLAVVFINRMEFKKAKKRKKIGLNNENRECQGMYCKIIDVPSQIQIIPNTDE